MASLRLVVLGVVLGFAQAMVLVSKPHQKVQADTSVPKEKVVDNPFAISEATMLEMEHNMTLDTAVAMFKNMTKNMTHAPAKLMAMVTQHVSRSRGFLGKEDPGAAAYAEASSTLQTINDMIEETMDKKENETIRCLIFTFRQWSLIEESKQDIASFTSRATAARAAILVAQGKISMFQIKIPLVDGQLWTHNTNCYQTIAAYVAQITVITGDIEVMKKVVKMAECGSGGAAGSLMALKCKKHQGKPQVSLLKIAEPTSGMQQLIMQLKSPLAKQQILRLLDSQTMYNATGLMQMAKDEQAEVQPGLDGLSETSPDDQERQENKCSFRDNPNCPILFNKFMIILGGLMAKKRELEASLKSFRSNCQGLRTNFESTLSNFNINLKGAQSDLAEQSKELTDSSEQLRLEKIHLRELYSDLFQEHHECTKAIATFSGEICGLRKIRAEMGKMDGGGTTFFQDCEVGEWIEDECSVPCGGGRTVLRRNITNPPLLGAPCPALVMLSDCNEQPCPIDCKLSDWSGWSECSADCGQGVSERSRNIIVAPEHDGEPCEDDTETVACNMQACDVPCVLSEWSEWSSCSKACDTGHIQAIKTVVVEAKGQGTCPEEDELDVRIKKEVCNDFPCAKNGTSSIQTLQCEAMIDLLVILDGSFSVGEEGWKDTVTAASNLVRAIIGGNESGEVAALAYGGPASQQQYDDCLDGKVADPVKDCGVDIIRSFSEDTAGLADTIAGLPWPQGPSTFTSRALSTARDMFGDSRKEAQSVVVLITDGDPISDDDTLEEANKIKEQARLLVVPVGPSINQDNIRAWVSREIEENIVVADNFTQLAAVSTVDRIIADICNKVK